MAADLQVLLWNPGASPFGGHLVQIDKTVQSLSQIDGISVRVCREETPYWDGVDIVHGLGLEQRHVREARQRGIPVCLSVIYLSKAYVTGSLVRRSRWQTVRHRARMVGVLALAAAQGSHVSKSEAFARFAIKTTALYEAADLLLPNSRMEANTLVRDLGVTTPLRVVPNAADPDLFRGGLPWDQREGVIYAGRLEPHKNQLMLIQALRGTGVPLTIVGGDHPHHREYAEEVRAAAGGLVRVVGHRAHDELPDLYARARVHAMPSKFETTGLASLEAAMSGCNVVTTDAGYALEYFEDLAWYCSPYDPSTIRSAVLEALSSPPKPALQQRILDRYTWKHAAEATVTAYRDLLSRQL